MPAKPECWKSSWSTEAEDPEKESEETSNSGHYGTETGEEIIAAEVFGIHEFEYRLK